MFLSFSLGGRGGEKGTYGEYILFWSFLEAVLANCLLECVGEDVDVDIDAEIALEIEIDSELLESERGICLRFDGNIVISYCIVFVCDDIEHNWYFYRYDIASVWARLKVWVCDSQSDSMRTINYYTTEW